MKKDTQASSNIQLTAHDDWGDPDVISEDQSCRTGTNWSSIPYCREVKQTRNSDLHRLLSKSNIKTKYIALRQCDIIVMILFVCVSSD